MLLKYEQAQGDVGEDVAHDSEERDMFTRELHELGEFIFEEKYHAIVDFIVDTDGVTICKAAFKELKTNTGFLQSMFTGEKYNLRGRDTHPYYLKSNVKVCLAIIEHDMFNGSIMVVIIINTICLSIDTYRDPEAEKNKVLRILNLIFTGIFTFECYARMTGLGLREYCAVGFNVFDLLTVSMSLI